MSRMDRMDRKKLIDVAMGRIPADLVLRGATVVNVLTERLEQVDVAICDGVIAGLGSYTGKETVDLTGKFLAPGFMDGHIHLESSLLTPAQFQRAALPHGTCTVVADPHEIANVSGLAGIEYLARSAGPLLLRVYFTMSSCVPASPLEEAGCTLTAEDIRPCYEWDSVLGLAEVMDAAGVAAGDPELLAKIRDAKQAGKVVDGHAPGACGAMLNAYAAAGIGSDHECTTAEEAIEKQGRGLWIMVREGTAAKNLEGLRELCERPYCYRSMFVTDDRHPEDLLESGHMDAVLRKAVALGVDPVVAIRMCTLHTARYFGLEGQGAIAPGYLADLVVLDDLETVQVRQVYVGGRLAAADGRLVAADGDPAADGTVAADGPSAADGSPAASAAADAAPAPAADRPAEIWQTFHMEPVRAEQLASPVLKDTLRVIGLVDRELITRDLRLPIDEETRAQGGVDPKRDIIKMAVLERHHGTGHIGIGFLKGYGLREGAVATSVAHDSHNLIVAGVRDEDMALAADRVRQMNGGMVVASGGRILAELALPVAGLMSPLPAEEVRDRLRELKAAARRLGVSERIDPFMTLGFVSLPVIPSLRLNGRGLIDVEKQEIVPVSE